MSDINYVEVVGEFYPEAQCYCVGNAHIYEDIVWILQ